MWDAKIITLYKNKGDRGECTNYRAMSLLCVAGKIFVRVLLKRLHRLADRILPETQSGSRAGRSTTYISFTLRQLRKLLYLAFIQLTKAFDTESWSSLCKVLECIDCPSVLLQRVMSFHVDMNAYIQFDGSPSSAIGSCAGQIFSPVDATKPAVR